MRIYKGKSSDYEVDKGLREGCPSSPALFNVYHHAVMEDFRCRRQTNAESLGMTPGLPWTLKIDGQCDHNYHSRAHLTGNSEDACLGEIVFADDTCLIGDATEIQSSGQNRRPSTTATPKSTS